MASTDEGKNLDITETLSRTELYVENNKKNISIALGVIVVLVGGYFAYKRFILEPKEREAQAQLFVAEKYFELDSLNLAINGDGNYLGFESIANDYGMTKSGNLAHYYLGICYLKKGEFDKAIDNLKKFDSKDEILAPVAIGAIGDAFMELGKMDEASAQYIKAADIKNNDFTSPIYLMKAGLAFEKAGKYSEAVSAYEKIKDKYAKSAEGSEIEKYIARAQYKVK